MPSSLIVGSDIHCSMECSVRGVEPSSQVKTDSKYSLKRQAISELFMIDLFSLVRNSMPELGPEIYLQNFSGEVLIKLVSVSFM